MSAHQKTRLLIAAKDLVRALSSGDTQEEVLMPVLGALRFQVESSYEAAREGRFNY